MKILDIKIPKYAAQALKMLENAGFEAWCVGGCVRDSIRGAQVHDWDICTSALPEQTLAVFDGLRTIPTGLKHGTVNVIIHGEQVEITTYRTDGDYLDHRRPESVQFVRDIRSDLERRDFTINAMCLSLRGELFDPFGGEEDIQRGVLRCVGDPKKRFDEDALRILRAVRFAAKTGFEVEENTARAAMEMRGLLDGVSAERIYAELRSLLVQPHAGEVLRRFREIIAQVIPEVRPCFDFPQNNPHHCYDVWEHITHSVDNIRPDPLLRLVMLLHDIGKPDMFFTDESGMAHFKKHQFKSAEYADEILRRMKSDNYTRERACALIAEHDTRFPPKRKCVAKFISKYDMQFFMDYLEIRRADTLAQSNYKRAEKLAALDEMAKIAIQLEEENACLKLSDLAINGRDAAALGLKGKAIGDALKQTLAAVVEERVPNERGALLGFIRENCAAESGCADE